MARRYCSHYYGSETRGFSRSLASAWTGPATPTAVSPTDARDACVIADQAPMRSDLGKLRQGSKERPSCSFSLLAAVTSLRTRVEPSRLREALVSLFAALERALDVNSKGPLILLTHYQSPAVIDELVICASPPILETAASAGPIT